MSDPASLASLFAAAEQAAISGDFAAAARCLADAARAQEAALGPDHLDLANTLNNLAVAHERSGQLDDAEREYRRAHAIAARTLPADHPQVTTSAQNLREFCQANSRPLVLPESPSGIANDSRPKPGDVSGDVSGVVSGVGPGVVSGGGPGVGPGVGPASRPEPLAITFAADAPAGARVGRPAAPAAPIPPMPALEPRLVAAPEPAAPRVKPRIEAPAPTAAPIPARRSWLPVLLVLGAIGVLLIWLLTGRGPADPPATPQAATLEGSPPLTPAAAPAPAPPPPARDAAPPATAKPVPAAPATTARAGADGVSVGEARLCTTLAPGYRCDPATSPVRPGSLTYYTRVVATSDTSVVHRWYRGGELRQAVRLDVPPRRGGFRTFSRATVSPSEGEWRVELRTRDGRLLHTETFTVR